MDSSHEFIGHESKEGIKRLACRVWMHTNASRDFLNWSFLTLKHNPNVLVFVLVCLEVDTNLSELVLVLRRHALEHGVIVGVSEDETLDAREKLSLEFFH